MPVIQFPNPRETGPDGLVALGGDLAPESLVLAYRQGIFPWPSEGYPLLWFCPVERAVLDFADLHIPRSLEKLRKKRRFRVTIDQAFAQVIQACARAPRPGQDGTWITAEMVYAYIQFHGAGYAHSFEVWSGPDLVGGMYGVEVDGVFSGESMFHHQSGASKIAVLAAIDFLKEKGLEWMDIQTMTPHMEALGAHLISRDEFLERLPRSHRKRLRPFSALP